MKTKPSLAGHRAAAFTLIEMIGVLAILTIMAGVLTPNILHSLERAAIRAETDNLHSLGAEIGLYLRDNGAVPTAAVPPSLPNWTTQLAVYSSMNASDILTNRRQMNRMYVPDPIAANQRALLLSSMRTGVALPSAANVSGNFQAIWNTTDGNIPPAPGWNAWNAANIEYLVIERVSFASIYRTDLQTYGFTLNNSGTGAVSYKVTYANGTSPGVVNLAAGATTATPLSLKAKDRLSLYSDAGGVTLNFSYMVSNSPKTFTFTTGWVAQ